MEIRDLIGVADDPAFRRFGCPPRGGLHAPFGWRAVLLDPVPHLFGDVQTSTVHLDLLDDAHALLVVPEAVREELTEKLFADVAKGRVTDVVPHRHRLDEVFVEAQGPGHRAPDLRDLERVRESRAVVVADRSEE